MWRKNKCNNKQINDLSSVILTGNYPAVILNKINYVHLENIVTQLALYTRRGNRYYVSSKLSRPRWWPKHLKFEVPITKLRPPNVDHLDSPFKWSRALCEAIKSCSRFHYRVNQRFRKTVLTMKQFALPRSHQYFRQCKRKVNSYTTSPRRNKHNKIPYVKLHDVVQQNEIKINQLPKFVVKLSQFHKKSHRILPEKNKAHLLTDVKIMSKAYVRLHDICDTQKQTECTEEDYMEYLKLGHVNRLSSLNKVQHKPNQSKVFRNFNIPVSSELGQMMVPMITDNNNTLWRLQRLEWFLKETPQVKCEQEYPVVFTQRQNNNLWMHKYKFPKRQYFQMRCSPKRYHKLGVCKPVCVELERLELQKDRYAKYLDKFAAHGSDKQI